MILRVIFYTYSYYNFMVKRILQKKRKFNKQFLEEQINNLRDYPRYIVNPKNPTQQKKLPVHDMLKDYQAQKNDIATKILRTLDGETIEESPLLKALSRYTDDD